MGYYTAVMARSVEGAGTQAPVLAVRSWSLWTSGEGPVEEDVSQMKGLHYRATEIDNQAGALY
ncbi:hypothetical protein PGTUg99_006012 [Puccinia graminis f. sp. tritici]|nr:hypothetical protein PGTUg99_006012 [Puccinia graminis f. sp. tritici]